MGPWLFGHMGLCQWGCWETKPGGETKAPSPSPPAMAARTSLPGRFPTWAAHWGNWVTWGSAAQCDTGPSTARAAPPPPALGSAAMGGINTFFAPCSHFRSLVPLQS